MSEDYQRISRAIEYLQAHRDSQPSLAEVAAQVHLSEYHFQRVFSRWAGVTPKRYLQALTLARAKQLLREDGLATLQASYATGLSSGSRLYDHFVQIDGVTPSEYRQRGRGLTLVYGYCETLYGPAFLALAPRGICRFEFVAADPDADPCGTLEQEWPEAVLREDPEQIARVVSGLFAHPGQAATPLSLWVRGTNFQLQVWRALLQLQPGEVASYGAVAQAIGKPAAARAVGSAIGANPVALIIPCHRVLRQSGALGGYRWGEVRKQAILAREAAAAEAVEGVDEKMDET